MDTEDRLTTVRGEGVGGWVRRVKELRKEKQERLMDTRQSSDCQREGRGGEAEEGKGGMNGDGRRLGVETHNAIYR